MPQLRRACHPAPLVLSQYPHYSCTTTGSSLNQLWRELLSRGLSDKITWSVIDRWPVQSTFVSAVAERILKGLEQFPREFRSQVRVA